MKHLYRAAVFALLFPLPVSAQIGEWRYDARDDGFTDNPVHIANVVVMTDSTLRKMGHVSVRCRDGQFTVAVSVGEFLTANDRVQIRYRVDDRRTQSGRWPVSTNGDAVFSPHPVTLARWLMEGRSLLFEAKDYRGTPHQATFSLNGSQEAIQPVLAACQR